MGLQFLSLFHVLALLLEYQVSDFCCIVISISPRNVCVMCIFLTGPWVGQQCVMFAFSGHTHCLYILGHSV